MTTHTNDCSSCDYRIAKVPQQNHSVDAVHQVVLATADYPRYVGTARGDVFKKENLDKRFHNWTNSPTIGVIPQVSTTFAYIDGLYGIINEHQVAIGESTCGARFVAKPLTQGGEALFDVAELSRIALQRTKTAREAIQLMGDLAVKYGYYGAEWEGDDAHEEAGEALTITDTKEAWMFHILPDDTGKSAIWVAQRVPDDHISVVANQFVIHEIDLVQSDYFMASSNIYDVAIRNHIWSPDTGVPFDFTREYSQPRESTHQYYSTRRMWRIFTLADPQLDLSPYTDVYASDYPFSIKVTQTLTPHDLMRFQRDHYENTPFDMTNGPAGGPYGNPDRYDGGVNGDVTKEDLGAGHFERAVSIFRASYSFVSVLDPSNADHAFLWFGQYAPHATSYAPVYAKSDVMPTLYSNSSLHSFDRGSSFWIYALVGNWASRFYIHAHAFVKKVQLELENNAEGLLIDIATEAARIKRLNGEVEMRRFLTNHTAQFAKESHAAFSNLFENLVTSFHDGYQVSGMFTSRFNVHPLFYPKWWLELVGFFNGSSQPAVRPLNERNKNEVNVIDTESSPRRDIVPGGSYVTTAIIAVAAGCVGIMIGKKYAPASYEPIH